MNKQHKTHDNYTVKSKYSNSTKSLLLCLGITIFMGIILFWPGISDTRKTLWFSDGNVVQHRNIAESIQDLGGFGYTSGYWLGSYNNTGAQFYPNWPIIAFLPVGVGMWLNIFLHIILAAAGGWYCARALGISKKGAIISGIAFGLNGHFLSLMGAGHLGKLQCIPWIPWVFGLFWQGWKSGNLRYFIMAAIGYAAMWQSGEPPIAYFLGMFLGILTITRTITSIASPVQHLSRNAVWKRTAFSALFIVITIPMAWQSITANISFMEKFKPATHTIQQTEKVQQKIEESDAEKVAKYDFATSWSFPPEETLVFLMSGRLFGVSSPIYWGRTGSKTMKLKQVDDYMGVLVVLLALIALTTIRSSPQTRFLTFILCTSLIIGFGGFTPVYRIVYQLPVFSSLRVPARWIALTAFAFSMLAGIGYDRFIALAKTRQRLMTRNIPILIMTAGTLFLLTGILLHTGRPAFSKILFGATGILASSPQPKLMNLRMGYFISAFTATGASLLLIGILFRGQKFVMQSNKKILGGHISRSTLWVVLAGFILAGDLAINDKHYISFFNWKQFYAPDGLVSFFKQDTDQYSILTLATQRHQYLNRFATYIAPWNKLTLVEPHVVHRQQTSIIPLLNALSKPVNYHINHRFYDYFGVKYILSPMQLPPEILTKENLQQLNRFNFPQMPPLFLYQYRGYKTSPYIVGKSIRIKSDKNALNQIANPAFDIRNTVLLEGKDINTINRTVHGSVKITRRNKRNITIEAHTDGPALIVQRIAYTPNWVVTVNGKAQDYYKANYMQIAIPIESGHSRIEMKYQTSRKSLFIVIVSWIMVFLLSIFIVKKPPVNTLS